MHKFTFWVSIMICHFGIGMSHNICQNPSINFLLITICNECMSKHMWTNSDWFVRSIFFFCERFAFGVDFFNNPFALLFDIVWEKNRFPSFVVNTKSGYVFLNSFSDPHFMLPFLSFSLNFL